jgi:hypothetical protein
MRHIESELLPLLSTKQQSGGTKKTGLEHRKQLPMKSTMSQRLHLFTLVTIDPSTLPLTDLRCQKSLLSLTKWKEQLPKDEPHVFFMNLRLHDQNEYLTLFWPSAILLTLGSGL